MMDLARALVRLRILSVALFEAALRYTCLMVGLRYMRTVMAEARVDFLVLGGLEIIPILK